MGNKWDDEAKDPVIDDCAGFCGTINLAKGSLPDYYPPFVGVAFNVAGSDSKKDDLYTADVTKWGGVCVTYTSDIDIKFNLGLSKQDDALVKSDVARVILKSSKTPVQKCYQWKNFEQEGWGPEDGYAEISGPESAKKLASLRFQMQSDVVKTGKFNIISVGTYNKLYE